MYGLERRLEGRKLVYRAKNNDRSIYSPGTEKECGSVGYCGDHWQFPKRGQVCWYGRTMDGGHVRVESCGGCERRGRQSGPGEGGCQWVVQRNSGAGGEKVRVVVILTCQALCHRRRRHCLWGWRRWRPPAVTAVVMELEVRWWWA
jgi:hypothetical protein